MLHEVLISKIDLVHSAKVTVHYLYLVCTVCYVNSTSYVAEAVRIKQNAVRLVTISVEHQHAHRTYNELALPYDVANMQFVRPYYTFPYTYYNFLHT